MRLRMLGLAVCLGLIALLLRFDRFVDNALSGRAKLASASSLAQALWPAASVPAAIDEAPARGAETRGLPRDPREARGSRKRPPSLFDAMDPPLQDALRSGAGGSAPGSEFWDRALKGVRSARKDGRGRIEVTTRRSGEGGFRAARRTSRAASRSRKSAGRRKSSGARSHGREARVKSRGRTRSLARGGRALSRQRPRVDFDGSRNASSRSLRASLKDSGLELGSWYRKRSAKENEAKKKEPKLKEPKLSDWLGKKPIKRPTAKMEAPTFASLKHAFPPSLPDGKPFESKTPRPAHLEKLIPPGEHEKYERWLEKDKHRGRGDEPHWHIDEENTPFLHVGKSWGRSDGGRWSWMILSNRRWWTVADKAQRMARHGGRWWWRTESGWFLLHEGEPWAYRHYARWQRDGLIHPNEETTLAYSEDARRVAVTTPGEGTRVFDAHTGEALVLFPEKR
ncbi:MAG: hypothetical protein ABII00_16275 [Elusimicrobiota bacterium]